MLASNGMLKKAQYHLDMEYKASCTKPHALRWCLLGKLGTLGVVLLIEGFIGRGHVKSGRKNDGIIDIFACCEIAIACESITAGLRSCLRDALESRYCSPRFLAAPRQSEEHIRTSLNIVHSRLYLCLSRFHRSTRKKKKT